MNNDHDDSLADLIADFHRNHLAYRNQHLDYIPLLRNISYINHEKMKAIPDIIHFI